MIDDKICLSFIAPIYNTSFFLERFLHSYFSQSQIDKTELIIVDDCSIDNSLSILDKILKNYESLKNNVKLIKHKKNLGLAAARQTGLNAACGKYVIFVDSDDFFDSELTSTVFKKIEETNADIITCDIIYENLTDRKYIKCKYSGSKSKIIKKILNNTIGNAGQYTRIVKTELFEKANISFTPGINMFEDRLLAVKLFSNAKHIIHLKKAFYHYVQYNNNSITKSYSDKTIEEMILAKNEIENYLLCKKKSYKKSILDFSCYIKFLLWLSDNEKNKELSREIFPEAEKRLLFTKSIPKFHTRLIFYNYLKGNIKTVNILNKLRNKFKKKENNLNNFTICKDYNYDVSVIIVNYNTRELLRNCLNSLLQNTNDISFEVFVSDNGSKDASIEMLKENFPQVKIIDNQANLGFGAANNRALEKATGKYIFYLNSDTIVENNAIKIFFDYWEENSNENIGALGANLLDENHNIIHSAGTFRTIGREIKDAFHDLLRSYKLINPYIKKKKLGSEPPLVKKIIGDVDYITGADLFVKNDEFAWFDEKYFLYYEETDMQKRMEMAGKRRILIDGPLIQHLKGGSDISKNPLLFYKGVSKSNSLLSSCIFQHKFFNNRFKLFILKTIITMIWLNPALVGKTGKYIKKLWKI